MPGITFEDKDEGDLEEMVEEQEESDADEVVEVEFEEIAKEILGPTQFELSPRSVAMD